MWKKWIQKWAGFAAVSGCWFGPMSPAYAHKAAVITLSPLSQADKQLLEAARAQNLEGVKSALRKGANVNCQSREPILDCMNLRPQHLPKIQLDTPLFLSLIGPYTPKTAHGDDRVFRFLLSRGANPNIAGGSGFTPLFASVRHSVGATKALLDAGASLTARTEHGTTVLEDAALRAQPQVVKLLLAHGAKVNEGGEFGFTPFDRALQSERWENARILQAAGAKSGIELQTIQTQFLPRYVTEYSEKLQKLQSGINSAPNSTTN